MQSLSSPSRSERLATWVVAAALFLVPLVHSGSVSDPFSLPKEIVILATALLVAGIALASFLFEERPPGLVSPAHWIALAFLACAGIAVVPAANHGLALWGLLHLAAGATVFWGVARFVRDPAGATLLLRASLLSAALVALGSLSQVFAPGESLSPGGWSILPPGSGGATLGGAGIAAQIFVLALPIGIGAAASGSGRWRLAAGGLAGLAVAALVFAGRPEGWIAGGVAVAFIGLLRILQVAVRGRRWSALAPEAAGTGLRAFLVAGLVLVTVVALARSAGLLPSGRGVAPLDGVSLLVPTTGDPDADRPAAARGTRALLRLHPLGVGPENWRHAFLEVAWSKVDRSPFTLSHQAVHAGDSFLEMAAETGIAGGACFAILYLLVLAQAGLAVLRAPDSWRPAAFAACAGLAALGPAALLGAPFQEPALALLFWVMAGLAQAALVTAGAAPGFLGRLAPRERSFVPRALRRRRVGFALAGIWIVAVVLLAARVLDRVQAARYALAGQSAYYAGQYQPALLAFGQPAARRSPDHLPRVLAASAYLKLGFYERARREFGEAILRSPWFVAAYMGRASALQSLGRYDLADQDMQAALRIWPGNADIHVALGKLNTTRGLFDAALDEYRKALQINPNLAEAYVLMGGIFTRRGQIDDAIEAYRVGLTKNPRYPRINISLGDAFSRKGLPEMALRYYQAAATLDEKAVEPRLLIANTYHLMGQSCEAKDALEAARDLETDTRRRDEILDLIRKVEPDCARQLKKQAPKK